MAPLSMEFPRQEYWASLLAQTVKDPPASARDACSIPGLERSPEEGNGNPLQHSYPDRGAWRTTYSPWGHKESDVAE